MKGFRKRFPGRSSRPPEKPKAAVPAPAPDQTGIVAAVNRSRESFGLPALVHDPILAESARRAAEYAARQRMLHNIATADGGTHRTLIVDSGAKRDKVDDEAIQDAVKFLLESPQERHILLSDFDRVGAGYAKDVNGSIYYAIEYGKSESDQ